MALHLKQLAETMIAQRRMVARRTVVSRPTEKDAGEVRQWSVWYNRSDRREAEKGTSTPA